MAQGEVLAQMVLEGEGSFLSGIEDAGDEMEDASRSAGVLGGALGRMGEQISDALIPARLLGSQLDKAGDEASKAGIQAGAASVGFMSLSASSTGLSVSLGILSVVGTKTALVLGALALAAGAVMIALAPIAIGAAAIASAFGLIVGSGILAWGSGFQKTLKKVKKQITPLVKEFGQKFVPFLKQTLGMLPGLAKELLNAVGSMGPFLSALRRLRNVAFDVLPKIVSWFFDIGRWALPIVMKLATGILNNLLPALRKITSTGKGTVQEFSRLRGAATSFWQGLKPVLAALGPLVGELLKLGGILLTVALRIGGKLLPMLAPLLDWITRLLKGVNNFAMSLGGVTSATNKLSPRLVKLKNEVLELWGNLQPLISTLMDLAKRVAPFVMDYLNYVKDTLIDLGLVVLNVINGDFGEAKDVFIRIFRRMRDFYEKWGGKLLSWLQNTLVPAAVDWFGEMGEKAKKKVEGWFGDLVSWLKNDAKSDLKSAAGALGDALANAFKDAFNAAIPDSVPIPEVTLGKNVPGPDYTIGGGDLDLPSLASGGRLMSDGLFFGHAGEQVMTAAEVDKAEDAPGGGGGPQQVVVQLDADAVTDLLRGEAVDVFDSKIQDTERKKRRRGTF